MSQERCIQNMTYDKTQSIDAFLSATAAKQPTPGGGSVAALAGALSAAIGEMVVNYSVGKKDLAQHQAELQSALTELTRARQIMLELMVEDQVAFEELSACRKLPASDPQRAQRFEAALLVCIGIPQSIGATAAAILRSCDRLVEMSNRFLLSDLAVCAELAMATVRCAAYNVRINLADVDDPQRRLALDSAALKQVIDASRIIQQVVPRIWTKLEKA
jgi:formiminotetrahydrofolate cyclodeaminase